MPFRKIPYRKKRPFKKRVMRVRRPLRLASPNRPAVHFFKRSFTQVLNLSNVTPPVGWTAEGNGIWNNFQFTLNDVTSATDFTNLFAMYKLNSVKTEVICSNSTSVEENSQLMVYWDTNVTGQNYILTEQVFLDSQTSRHMVIKPPHRGIKMYGKLKQLSNTYKLTDDDYAIVKPRYISTEEPNTPHYGTAMRIQRVDGLPMGTQLDNFQTVKLIHTVYLSCKKVH